MNIPKPGPATLRDADDGLDLFTATKSPFGLFAGKPAPGSIGTLAVTGVFASASGGTLTVFGDNLDNSVNVSRNAAGQLLINGGAVAIAGGTPTVANTGLIQVFGQGGNDVITLDERNGAMPRSNLFGGTGNDSLTGGAGTDMLFGQSGNDTLLGKGGRDSLFGGTEDDVLTGGDGDDMMFGESGNDRMIWNPGDDTDTMEGGAGIDTAEVNGGNGAEIFAATANGTRVRFDRIDPAPFELDIGTTEKLTLNMNGGDDRFSATGNLAALIAVTVDGGTGNDTIFGSNGSDLLIGGDGNDIVDGQQGNDTALLGAGHDLFQWDPGDGSDVVEGQDGGDTLLFNGSAGNELFEALANGGRTLFTRNLGNIVMDLEAVETIVLNALGGTDTVTVRDLTGTDVQQVNVDLAGTLGGSLGDAAADVVVVQGRATADTAAGDVIDVVGAGSSVSVLGLAARVNVAHAEGANDALVIQGLGGHDGITASTLAAGIVKLTLDGGAGDDVLLGSQGGDLLIGGEGHDFVFGDNGDDTALLGAGDDRFQWAPGDGSDVVEGQDGFDTMDFIGSNAAEGIRIAAAGGRVLLQRDVAAVTMDLNDVERIEFRALGGADDIVIGDLGGTDIRQVAIDLTGPNGGGDGAADTVTADATQAADVFGVANAPGGGLQVFGLAAAVTVQHAEGHLDRLVLNGHGGDDLIDAASLSAGRVLLTLNGGLGDDVLIGGSGDETFVGGDGDDIALMGGGDDSFVWNPGDDNDVLEGQAGHDTLLFNGSNASEVVSFSANGGRVLMQRDVANVRMDLNDVETVDFRALGGADRIEVNDLSGTDVVEVNIDLRGSSGSSGSGDGAADTVVISGTAGDDVILLAQDGNGIVVLGLAAAVRILGFEIGVDRLVINGLAGDDVIEGSGMASIGFSADGGSGDDVIVGGGGNDTLTGGAGDDVVLGGGGVDVIDGGIGDDVEIQGIVSPEVAAAALFG